MMHSMIILVFLFQAQDQVPSGDVRSEPPDRIEMRRELDDFTKLLPDDGLTGWRTVGGNARFIREGDVIRGLESGSRNTFLMSEREYGDFILEGEVLIESGNSGWQIRSHLSVIDDPRSRLFGYQIEIDSSDRSWSGGLYDEGRRGWIHPLGNDEDARSSFRSDEWNHFRIEAVGPTIRSWVNGTPCADVLDLADLSGSIALQVHSGKCKVNWRNLEITDLGQSAYTRNREWLGLEDPDPRGCAFTVGEQVRLDRLPMGDGFSIRIPYQIKGVASIRLMVEGEDDPLFETWIGDRGGEASDTTKSDLPMVAPGAGMVGLGDEWKELLIDLDSGRLVIVDEGILKARIGGLNTPEGSDVSLVISCSEGGVRLKSARTLEKVETRDPPRRAQ